MGPPHSSSCGRSKRPERRDALLLSWVTHGARFCVPDSVWGPHGPEPHFENDSCPVKSSRPLRRRTPLGALLRATEPQGRLLLIPPHHQEVLAGLSGQMTQAPGILRFTCKSSQGEETPLHLASFWGTRGLTGTLAQTGRGSDAIILSQSCRCILFPEVAVYSA